MRRAGLLFEDTKEHETITFLFNEAPADDVGAASADVVNVVSRRVARIYDPETKRSREDLAVTAQLACVHTLLAMHVRGVHVMDSRKKLGYRGSNRRKAGCQQAGCPSSASGRVDIALKTTSCWARMWRAKRAGPRGDSSVIIYVGGGSASVGGSSVSGGNSISISGAAAAASLWSVEASLWAATVVGHSGRQWRRPASHV
ncbi:hypothetical protein F443_17539 [Phytophthora nicotianae P1569]|uniref:Uncharacterized protein n=1 Tax=Phytophthora nicotianae P1569 TaxID=1317065 RepID=V9EB41_PHYNI|nr:hypothetical protein F443_17539 [Phytophthora nicotianae P1569]